jgi:uncharacterized protein Yka (UPF0111/DUF47 family)
MVRDAKLDERTDLLCRAQGLDADANGLVRGADHMEFAHAFPEVAENMRAAAGMLLDAANDIREYLRKAQ